MSATGRRGEAGATLMEMLVVVGILGLVTALVFPAWISPLRRIQLYEARSALVSNLRLARALSVRSGEPVSFALAEDGRGYGWGTTRVYAPAPVSIVGDPITFYADGSSSGGGVTLVERERTVSVAVDPATGLTRPG